MGYHLDILDAIWPKTTTNPQSSLSWMSPYLHLIFKLTCYATLVWEGRSGLILRRVGNYIWICFLTMLLHSSSKTHRDLYSQSRSWDMSVVLKLSLPRGLDRLCNSFELHPTQRTPASDALFALVTCCNFQWDIWQPGICLRKRRLARVHAHTHKYRTHRRTHTFQPRGIPLFTYELLCSQCTVFASRDGVAVALERWNNRIDG